MPSAEEQAQALALPLSLDDVHRMLGELPLDRQANVIKDALLTGASLARPSSREEDRASHLAREVQLLVQQLDEPAVKRSAELQEAVGRVLSQVAACRPEAALAAIAAISDGVISAMIEDTMVALKPSQREKFASRVGSLARSLESVGASGDLEEALRVLDDSDDDSSDDDEGQGRTGSSDGMDV